MPDAREEILTRIRTNLRNASGQRIAYAEVPRHYRRAGTLDAAVQRALLLDRLGDYDADVHEVTERSLATAVAAAMARAREEVLLVPPGVSQAWLPSGPTVLRDEPPLVREQLTQAQAVLTPCAVAIAETGTIVVQHGPEQGRRVLTLLPDHHICVVRAEQIVETVSEGLARVNPSAPLTTISGPSATADIEMVRIRGVHGPRRLTVLLLQ